MGFQTLSPEDFEWITRPHAPDEPARHVAELSERAGFQHVRGNIWRYEPGAKGRRHRHRTQEETFVVLSGRLTMYLGDPPERREVPAGGVAYVAPGTAVQAVNDGDEDLVIYAHGYPPENEHAELLPPAA